MFSRLLALFVVVPALELYLLIRLGQWIGALETFGIILLTGLIGSYLTKSQGLSVWRRFQTKLQSGGMPGHEMVDGVIILLSGALLITPGVLTDFVGLLGLIPVTRALVRKHVYAKFLPTLSIRSMTFGRQGMGTNQAQDPFAYPGNRRDDANSTHGKTNNGFTESDSGTESPANSGEPDFEIGGSPKRRPSG